MSIQQLMDSLSQQNIPASTLYVISTPIGNMGDISLRALHILGLVDAIACEDTRVTKALLSVYGINKELVSAHKHNEREAADKLIMRLKQGERIALVSDAGTPAISDPGAKIVDTIRQAGLNIIPIPGPSAAITALSVSGLQDEHFLFIGFLPTKSLQRHTLLESLKEVQSTLIIYEAPHRILNTIETMIKVFEPTRQIVMARELTKLFEEIHRCQLSEIHDWFQKDSNHSKGEFVILVEGAHSNLDEIDQDTKRILNILLSELSVSSAADIAAKITGQKKNKLYEAALQMSNTSE